MLSDPSQNLDTNCCIFHSFQALASHLWPHFASPRRSSRHLTKLRPPSVPQHLRGSFCRFCSGSRGCVCLIRAPLPPPAVVISVRCGWQLSPGGQPDLQSYARRLPTESNAARGGRGGIPGCHAERRPVSLTRRHAVLQLRRSKMQKKRFVFLSLPQLPTAPQ